VNSVLQKMGAQGARASPKCPMIQTLTKFPLNYSENPSASWNFIHGAPTATLSLHHPVGGPQLPHTVC